MSQPKIVSLLSFPLASLIIISSVAGLFTPGFYAGETVNWQAQSIGQDGIDLFLITPVLLATTIFAAKKNNKAMLLWGGVNLYIIYTYIIYCFDVPFNKFFVVYCLTLGLSFYSFLYFMFLQISLSVEDKIFRKPAVKIIGIYLLVISCMFYFLWLSTIIPPILVNQKPKEIAETGLLTNPVHVIDLSVILPAFFLTSIFIFKKKTKAVFLIPTLLVFCILMDITIGTLTLVMKIKKIATDDTVMIIMSLLALLSGVLLVWFFRSTTMYFSKSGNFL